MTVENTISNLAKNSQSLADQAADKAQSGILSAQSSVQAAGDTLSNKVSDVQRQSRRRVQSAAQQGLDSVSDIAGHARDFAGDAVDSLVSYTKKNPLQALAIAAAAGALVYAATRTYRYYRD
jgi:ElaB/YqjD/DUF883 family membrane-anchored ribosome-binding protein